MNRQKVLSSNIFSIGYEVESSVLGVGNPISEWQSISVF